MNNRGNYDFCPKCGALIRDGVCTSCGFETGLEENPYYQDYLHTDQKNNNMPGQGYNMPARSNYPYGQYGGGNGPHTGYGYPGQGVPEPGKSGNTAAVAVACVLLSMLGIGLMMAGILVTSSLKQYKEYAGRPDEPVYSYDYEEKHVAPDYDYDYDYDYGYDYGYDYEPYHEPGDEYGVTPDALYYEGLTNVIDRSVDYHLNFVDYEGPESASMQVSYVQFSGPNIPNLNDINEEIKYYSLWFADSYYEQYVSRMGEDAYYHLSVESYVTFNDERQASIVLDERLSTDEGGFIDLVSINVDLMNGRVTDNTDVLNLDEEFIKEFRKRNSRQNTMNMDDMSDEEIYNALTDLNQLILFYTPLGMEIGFNYVDENGYTGWVTVTYKDYDRYLKQVG